MFFQKQQKMIKTAIRQAGFFHPDISNKIMQQVMNQKLSLRALLRQFIQEAENLGSSYAFMGRILGVSKQAIQHLASSPVGQHFSPQSERRACEHILTLLRLSYIPVLLLYPIFKLLKKMECCSHAILEFPEDFENILLKAFEQSDSKEITVQIMVDTRFEEKLNRLMDRDFGNYRVFFDFILHQGLQKELSFFYKLPKDKRERVHVRMGNEIYCRLQKLSKTHELPINLLTHYIIEQTIKCEGKKI